MRQGTNAVFVSRPNPKEVEVGQLYTLSKVTTANVARDMLANLKNLVGGSIGHYSNLINQTVEAATKELAELALNDGYDGIVDFRICSPHVTDGAVEIIVYGNGFHFIGNRDK